MSASCSDPASSAKASVCGGRQIERPNEEGSHLLSRDRRLRAEEVEAATERDTSLEQPLNVGLERVSIIVGEGAGSDPYEEGVGDGIGVATDEVGSCRGEGNDRPIVGDGWFRDHLVGTGAARRPRHLF